MTCIYRYDHENGVHTCECDCLTVYILPNSEVCIHSISLIDVTFQVHHMVLQTSSKYFLSLLPCLYPLQNLPFLPSC